MTSVHPGSDSAPDHRLDPEPASFTIHTFVLAACVALSLAGLSCTKDETVAPPEAGPPEINLPLTVGTVWTFAYSYHWTYRGIEFEDVTGIHTWRLAAADTTATPRTYEFVAHQIDTALYSHNHGQGVVVDSTVIRIKYLPFSGAVTSDSITLGWPATIKQGSIPVDRIPRILVVGTNSIRLKGVFGGAINYDALYEQGRGLVSYASSISVMSGAYTLSFTLTSLVKP